MVSATLTNVMLVAQVAERKVPEPTRTIVYMALLGIVLVGLLLIAATMLGASWVRKQGYRRRNVVPQDTFLRHKRPAPPRAIQNGADRSSGDTLPGNDTKSNDDTVVS